MRKSIEDFFEEQGPKILLNELYTGCSHCGRRMLQGDDMLRDDVTVIELRDEETDIILAKYVVCRQCATNFVVSG